ncbi:MAG TPA: hypothetical protein VFI13_05670, partial [Gemmatimonadales bacterium]|nr:hypothetical protein [Gemmatimonadales bacterium]
TLKSAVPNKGVFSLSEGALVEVPSPNGVGAGAPAPGASILAYAWTGGWATIGSQELTQKAGLLEGLSGGYTLTVDGSPAASAVP